MIDREIEELWQRARPTVEERVELLEAAARAAAAGNLEPELRKDAVGAAHKLGGSLGIYGLPRGSELAREVEAGLEGGRDPDRLAALVAELRTVTMRTTPAE